MSILLDDSMESLYKDALRHLKIQKNVSPMFNTQWSYMEFKGQEDSSEADDIKAVNKVTEKVKMLDSLKKFGEEALEKTDKKALLFPGGELRKIENAELGITRSVKSLSRDEIYKELFRVEFTKESLDLRYKNIDLDNIKVLFVSDCFRSKTDNQVDSDFGDLSLLFEDNVSELFSKMIKAMGISQSEYRVSAVTSKSEDDESFLNYLYSEILLFNPTLIITLGAKATNDLLGLKSRLKDIHGKFYDLSLNDESEKSKTFEVMPLFSPSLLQTAPNMKKTAWKDMQKAMDKLNP